MPKYIMGPSMQPNKRNIGPRYTQEQRENLAYYRWQIRLCDREITEQLGNVDQLTGWRAMYQQAIRDIQRAARTVR